MHAPTGQMNNGDQSDSYSRGDKRFAELFPGLMKEIIKALQSKAEEIKQNSTEITRGGYDITKAIADIKDRLPASYASEAPKSNEPEATQDANDGPGTYLVTQIASGKTARIEGENRQDIITKLTTRYPDSTEADYTIEKQD